MNVCLLPSTLKDEIQKMINFFWWGSRSGTIIGINWLSWEKLMMKKEFGGLEFQHLYVFNLSMLGNQGYKFSANLDAIATKVFQAKYFHNDGFMEAPLGHKPSYIWHNIHT